MKIVKPSAEIVFPTTPAVVNEMLLLVEKAARLCYKTEGKVGETFNAAFIRDKIDRGHHSVIEHSLVSVHFIVDRGISHEIVRHRLASYSQESTRYCNYSTNKFSNEITVVKPHFWEENTPGYIQWVTAMADVERAYFKLLNFGASPQEARSVLPNSLKTELVMSANFREWRHFLQLRTSSKAHPQMQEVARPLLEKFVTMFPVIFSDIGWDN